MKTVLLTWFRRHLTLNTDDLNIYAHYCVGVEICKKSPVSAGKKKKKSKQNLSAAIKHQSHRSHSEVWFLTSTKNILFQTQSCTFGFSQHPETTTLGLNTFVPFYTNVLSSHDLALSPTRLTTAQLWFPEATSDLCSVKWSLESEKKNQ